MIKTITTTKKIGNDKSFTVFNDIQYFPGNNLDFLYKELQELEKSPTDYVLLLGDLIIDSKIPVEEYQGLRIFLEHLIQICKKQNIKIVSVLGNHDQMTRDKETKKWMYYYNEEYINMLKNMEELHLLQNIEFCDNDVSFIGTCFQGNYYLDNGKLSFKEKNVEDLEQYKNIMNQLSFSDDDTFNIILDHSPRRSFNKETFSSLEHLKSTDLVLSGHYHDGCVPRLLKKFPGNFGLISPYMEIFPKNSRGYKKITETTEGIIFPAIKEFDDYQGILTNFNFLFKPESQKVIVKRR